MAFKFQEGLTTHADALETMRMECAAQAYVINAVLSSVQDDITRIGAELAWALAPDRPLIHTGIGDSALVPRLARLALPTQGRFLKAATPEALALRDEPGIALLHSIGGETGITLALARNLRARGWRLVALTGAAQSSLVTLVDNPIVVDIPFYGPRAKVPGTLTVTVPLAVSLALAAELAGTEAALREMGSPLSTIDWTPVALTGISAVQVAGERVYRPVAEYLVAKIAEAVALPAVAADCETWLHTHKHAVVPGTLVVRFDGPDDCGYSRVIAAEAEGRGGTVLSIAFGGAPAADRERQEPDRPIAWNASKSGPGMAGLFHALGVCQKLILDLLAGFPDRAPFQRHRLTVREVASLVPRSYG